MENTLKRQLKEAVTIFPYHSAIDEGQRVRNLQVSLVSDLEHCKYSVQNMLKQEVPQNCRGSGKLHLVTMTYTGSLILL